MAVYIPYSKHSKIFQKNQSNKSLNKIWSILPHQQLCFLSDLWAQGSSLEFLGSMGFLFQCNDVRILLEHVPGFNHGSLSSFPLPILPQVKYKRICWQFSPQKKTLSTSHINGQSLASRQKIITWTQSTIKMSLDRRPAQNLDWLGHVREGNTGILSAWYYVLLAHVASRFFFSSWEGHIEEGQNNPLKQRVQLETSVMIAKDNTDLSYRDVVRNKWINKHWMHRAQSIKWTIFQCRVAFIIFSSHMDWDMGMDVSGHIPSVASIWHWTFPPTPAFSSNFSDLKTIRDADLQAICIFKSVSAGKGDVVF